MTDTSANPELWKLKLMAFLHDSPDKQFDLGAHETRAASFQRGAGYLDDADRKTLSEAVKPADHFSAAAERFVFPKGKCAHNFASAPLFIHPLSSNPIHPSVSTDLESAIQTAINGINTEDWHEKFFLYWRRWLDNVAAAHPQAAFLPADSRIPDHTIWNHMSVASALAPCIRNGVVSPDLILFQLGPVQDFIAQARTTRDLWSGSYLLSWLIAHALKAVSDRIGPDAVVFPSLRGNGIFDALHRNTFYRTPWQHGDDGKTQTTWERLLDDRGGWDQMADWILTPTLPNRFLAIVPPGQGVELAKAACAAIRAELRTIGEAVWQWLVTNADARPEWKERYDSQIEAFPQFAWAIQPWLDRHTCLAEARTLPDDKIARNLEDFIAFSEALPTADKDPRCFDPGGSLKNPGILWSAHYALLDARLAARRNTRDFAAWNPVSKEAAVKDSLSGKEECIGDEAFWDRIAAKHGTIFTAASHRYGAMNLVKRLWCHPKADIPHLRDKLGFEQKLLSRSVRNDTPDAIARRNTSGSPYIAVLAMDGDEMGQWVSGAKLPHFLKQLAPKAREHLKDAGDRRRLLTPSYHLQFSEALAAFAMHKARTIVEDHGGDLLYAGGDDVLAILPSTRAIECAQALRDAFRTDLADGRLYPGAGCKVSCGIAVGHKNAPLQGLVHEAREAEHRAKHDLGRAALALSLYKRSGETIHWGCRWDSRALALMKQTTALSAAEKLSGKFAYALAAILQPYKLDTLRDPGHKRDIPESDLRAILRAEFNHVLSRQGEGVRGNEREGFLALATQHLDELPDDALADFPNLFLAETFLNRFTSGN